MPAEEIEQRLAKLEKAMTKIDTARAHLVEEIQTLSLRAVHAGTCPADPRSYDEWAKRICDNPRVKYGYCSN